MMLTEEEAKWCPFARNAYAGRRINGPIEVACNRGEGDEPIAYCLAFAYIAWRPAGATRKQTGG